MLRRLCLQFAGARNIGQQRQVNVDGAVARQFVLQLPNCFEEGQAFDVADRSADLDEDEIEFLIAFGNEFFDGVSDVRNDLDRGAEIVAAPLLGDDVEIEAAGRDVVVTRRRASGKALVVAEVEICLRPIVGDEHLAMLVRAHRSRIDVEIRIELAQPDPVASRLQERAKRG